MMNRISEPERNVYLRSELRAMLRTLATIAGNSPNDEYRRGWLAALTALAMLVQVDMDVAMWAGQEADK